MNVYGAVERPDGRWDFCAGSQQCGLHPVGYCAGWRVWPKEMRGQLGEPVPDTGHRFHTDGHASREEAVECYRRFLLDHALRFGSYEGRHRFRCEHPLCREYTPGYAQIGKDWHMTLCARHQTREVAETLFRARTMDRVSGW